MWTGRCIAYLPDGHVCLMPAEYLDPQRRGLVCCDHRPAAPTDENRERLSLLREAAASKLVDCLLDTDFDSLRG